MARRAITHAGKPTRWGTAVGANATTRSAVRSVPVTPSAVGLGPAALVDRSKLRSVDAVPGFRHRAGGADRRVRFLPVQAHSAPRQARPQWLFARFSRCFRSFDFTVSATVGGEHPEQFGRVNLIRAAITARHT